MGRKRPEEIGDEDVTGLKYFQKLRPMLVRLHEVGCQRDKDGAKGADPFAPSPTFDSP
jgi:hypothetical protein